MTTKVNKQVKSTKHQVDKVIDFPIATGNPDSTQLDPRLRISDHDYYVFALIHEKLTNSRNAAQIHIQAMNTHQKAMNDHMLARAKELGINYTSDPETTEYVFNMDSHSFMHRSVPKSKGGLADEPNETKLLK